MELTKHDIFDMAMVPLFNGAALFAYDRFFEKQIGL